MPSMNPQLEPLPHGGTLLTWKTSLDFGGESHSQELQFAVRLNLGLVQRCIAELGPQRAVSFLWAHFRKIPSTQAPIDSERVSLTEWAQAGEALLAEVRDPPPLPGGPEADG